MANGEDIMGIVKWILWPFGAVVAVLLGWTRFVWGCVAANKKKLEEHETRLTKIETHQEYQTAALRRIEGKLGTGKG